MKMRNNLNLYVPVVFVALFSFILIFERIYTNGNGFRLFSDSSSNSLSLLSDEEWTMYYNIKDINYNEKSLIIYDHTLDFSNETKNNIKYVLSTMSVKTYTKDIDEISEDDVLDDFDTLVICVQDLSSIEYSVEKLKKYVFDGGGLLFAVDIIQIDNLDDYFELLGSTKVDNYVGVDSLVFKDEFLIGAKDKVFGKMIINANVLKFSLKDNVNVHVVSNDGNKVPLVWNFKYGDGYVGVSNSSLLTSKNGRGLVAALYSAIHDVFVYPVINAAVYFIDDFPAPVPSGYDEFVVREYGYSVKDFYTNVWWPTMYDIAKNKGVRFSAYIIQTYDDDVNGSFDTINFNEEYQYYINELLASGGEMGIHGYNHQPLVVNNYDYGEGINYNPWPSSDKAIGSIKTILNYTKEAANGSKVISYVPPSNILSEEMYLKMQEEIPMMKIFASLYVGDGIAFDQEFDVLENGTINIPRLYSGMEISNDSNYMLLNELSYHYVVSHFIHPDDILDPERRSEEGFAYMTDKYIELIDFVNSTKIRNTTISQTGAAIERYQVTGVNREYKNGKLKLKVSGIVDEVYYFLKTNGKKVKKAEGCLVEKIAENYYLLKISDKLVEIEME